MTETAPWNRRATPPAEPHLARLQKKMARGHSLEEAAEAVGLTLPLAKSVFIRSGLPVPKPYRHRVKNPLGRKIHDYLLKQDTATCRQIAEAVGATQTDVRRFIWDVDLPRMVRRPPAAARYPDAGILLGLQLMSWERGQRTGATGRVHVPRRWWDEHRDKSVHPPSAEIVRRWGTWRAACLAAGIPVVKRDRPQGPSRRFTDAQLEQVVRDFLAVDPEGNAMAYERYAEGRLDLPSGPTLTSRLGGWPLMRHRYGPRDT